MAQVGTSAGVAEELTTSVDSVGHVPTRWRCNLIPGIAFIWSIFQTHIASSLPFDLAEMMGSSISVVTDSTARLIHLSFAGFLVAMAFSVAEAEYPIDDLLV